MAYQITKENCTACGTCSESCPENAIKFAAVAGVYQVNEEKCVDCGACESACPSGAVRPLALG
jgi:ferredoxin